MKDMQAHIAKLRDQAAEAAMMSGEAQSKEKREFFANLNAHLTILADNAERALAGFPNPPDRFLGRKTQEPFPRGDGSLI